MKSILLVKKRRGLVEMTSGIVNASSSLHEWQATKMIFFATCKYILILKQYTTTEKANSKSSKLL